MKRILCIALTLVLLVSLVPAGALTVSAESNFTVSSEMVEILKKLEGFASKPYWDYTQYTVGYGTRPDPEDLDRYFEEGISKEEAEQLLYRFCNDMGEELNKFLDKNGLTVTQGMFDALLSLSFNCGTSWMYKESTFRTAVLESKTGNDFIFAIGQWCTSGGTVQPGLIRRRLIEANMYLNNLYDMTVPEDYCYVLYNANGGVSPNRVQAYDSDTPAELIPTPTYEGYVFDGWYTEAYGGSQVTLLTADTRNDTLYAHWRAGEGEGMPQQSADTVISGTSVSFNCQISAEVLSAFESPVKGALVVGSYKQGDIVSITQEYTDSQGVKWGQVAGGGWINLAAAQEAPEEPEQTTQAVTVTVTGNKVNVRKGPGTNYGVITMVNSGKQLTITETATGSGYTWGKSSEGWICLTYTNYKDVIKAQESEKEPETAVPPATEPEQTQPEETEPEQTEPTPTEPEQETPASGAMGTVTGDMLRIRSAAGLGNRVLGYLNTGDRVEITETKTVNGMTWGKITRGWISMDFVKLDTADTEDPKEPEVNQPEATDPPAAEPEPEITEPPVTEPEATEPEESKVLTGKVVVSDSLRIRSGAGTNYSIVGRLYNGNKVEITETKNVNGVTWGKIAKGWISMDYVKLDSTSGTASSGSSGNSGNGSTGNSGNTNSGGSNTGSSNNSSSNNGTASSKISGTVQVDGLLRIRSSAGSDGTVVGYLQNGQKVEILETKTVSGTNWGRISSGWISMDYVATGTVSEAAKQTGTIIADCLRVRSGAGLGNKIVGYLYEGAKVEILETKTVDGMTWGRISTGWISMDYVK